MSLVSAADLSLLICRKATGTNATNYMNVSNYKRHFPTHWKVKLTDLVHQKCARACAMIAVKPTYTDLSTA
jgi:hypothetical protein